MKLNHHLFARRALVIVAAPACAALGGCMTSTPIWDAHFGEAVKTVTQAQVIDPDAAGRNPSTPGIDGKAANSAMGQYQKSFDSPPPTFTPFVIGVGSGNGGGGGGGASGGQ
ncbi:hypothetical protein [Trinickia soli]|uniref:Pilus assembly protein n=1 Tax=Trinickia soli TaxID=380675 RepID=A0A2N7WG68_9BURK|nr:hypothetical protein [Trinickia soli]PMS28382.1 hypothetical protein C0Z19_01280 [Trinickia soli]CAB3668704.1 hypothetical protein LMG24076_01821 [Trinickia soli]